MLQFAGSVGFGVDVADLLELERAFHRHRPHGPPPKEQRIGLEHQPLGVGTQPVFLQQDGLDLTRHRLQGRNQLGFFGGVDGAAAARDQQHDQRQGHQLCGEGLGGRDTALRPGVGHERNVGLAHQ